MKKQIIFLFISLIFVFQYANAQNRSNDEKVVVAAATHLNILYMGLENPVDIAVSGIPADKIEVIVDNGQITGENGHYILKPDRLANCIISVFSDDTLMGKCLFKVRSVKYPSIYMTLAGKTPGEISKKEFVSGVSLKVFSTLGDYDFEAPEEFRIKEFQISSAEEGFVKVLKGTGSELSKDMIEFIRSLPVGSRIYINEIKGMTEVGERYFTPMAFILME